MVGDQRVDINAAGCDAGIRYGEHLAQDMIAAPIGARRQWAGLAASPAYLERFAAPVHPRDVRDHGCIRMRFASGALMEWTFEKDAETFTIDPPARLVIGAAGAAAAIDLAVAGHGLIYLFRNWLEPHFERGARVPVLRDWWSGFDGPRLYYSSRITPAPLRAFIDYIADQRALSAGQPRPTL